MLLAGKLWLIGQKVCFYKAIHTSIAVSLLKEDFRKIPDEEKLGAWKGLLKCEQHLCTSSLFALKFQQHIKLR